MKRTLTSAIGIILAWSCCATAQADTRKVSAPDAAQLFERAGQLYKDGEPLAAANLYSQLVEAGYRDHTVLYNHGNASLLAGELGWSILSYRRAWYKSPRDADTAANLALALQRAGVPPPTTSRVILWLRNASLTEWVILCQVSYWMSALIATLALAVKSCRKFCLRLVVVLWMFTAISLAGVLVWTSHELRHEAVAIASEHVRLAPSESAISYSPLPVGSIVHTLDVSGKWIKISTGTRAGWIPRTSIEMVRK